MRIPYEASSALGREFIDLAPEVAAAILLTLKTGWQHARKSTDLNGDAGEVVITEHLRDGMRKALRNSPWNLIVLPGTESRSKTSVAVPDGRTDIPLMMIEVFLRTQEHDPHAIIECKRIAGSDTHLCREYVVEGMDRFIQEKYGENHSAGFMVGYILSGTPSESAESINAYLNRVSRSVDRLIPGDITETTAWQSQHTRPSRAVPIRLHHAFLCLPTSSIIESK